MTKIELPDRVQRLVKSCPTAGNGVHTYIFKLACALRRAGLDDDSEIERLIDEAVSGCGREIEEREMDEAIRNSRAGVESEEKGIVRCTPRWPRRNEALIAAITKNGPDLGGLEARSPIRPSAVSPCTEEIIDTLFPGNPLLCAGTRKEKALTRPREEWRGFLDKQQFVVPSPMMARYGTTKFGERSMRSLENTGPRRFLVVEFDHGHFDQHAAILNHLARLAPLVMVVHSGNKSLHGWFNCARQSKEKLLRFFRYAVSLGADPATWTRCQWVRMPGGLRDNGKRQRAVFFNPAILEKP